MQTNNYSSASEMPNSCRSQVSAMEDAIRSENFCVAKLSDNTCGEIQSLENKISQNLGKKISLVAYEESSR